MENRVTKFFSSISMEIYLSHMMIFHVVAKAGITRMLGNGWLQYIATVVVVFAGTTVFAVVAKKGLNLIEKKIAGRSIDLTGR